MYVSHDLAEFLCRLRDCEQSTGAFRWVQALAEAAFTVWDHRYTHAIRSGKTCSWDRTVRGWLYGLPTGTLVYDLRKPEVRGWPMGSRGRVRASTAADGRPCLRSLHGVLWYEPHRSHAFRIPGIPSTAARLRQEPCRMFWAQYFRFAWRLRASQTCDPRPVMRRPRWPRPSRARAL
jgi:hypothetical protein